MRLLSRAEAAELLAVPPRSLADWAYRGDGPPYYRVGRHTRYREDELLEWLEGRRINGGGERGS